MMDPSKKDNFEDQWKKAFDEASVTPPASAWEAIEARLDQDENNKIVPLWWRSAKLWYAAASVAALFVVGSIWYSNKNSTGQSSKPDIASNITGKDKKTDLSQKPGEAESAKPIENEENKSINITSTDSKTEKTDKSSKQNPAAGNDSQKLLATTKRTGIKKRRATETGVSIVPDRPVERETEIAFNKPVEQKEALKSKKNADTQSESNKNPLQPKEFVPVNSENATVAVTENSIQPNNIPLVMSPDMLSGKSYKDLDVYFQKRYVFLKQDEKAVEPAAKKHTEYWASAGLMPASFNPDVSLKTSPSTFSYQSFSKQKSVIGKSEPGASYAMQTQGGIRISKHWSLETGIGYLQGNSSYSGGGYLLNAATNGSSNVLESALSDAYYGNKGSTPALAANNVYIDVNKQVRNDYKYLQVPVQTGFTLNPDGRLSYSVLGGMMANFFLGNSLESGNGDVIKTTASDDVYRSMNWAATTGLRFNYRLSSKWRASLSGSYQKSISSGVRSNQSLDAHPYLYGVSWGMRYSF